MIYHITTQQLWNLQLHDEEFIADDYSREGFIHCCTRQQLSGVLDRYFKGKSGLVALHIEEKKLKADLKYESSTNDEKFPHVYGVINRDAIVQVEEL